MPVLIGIALAVLGTAMLVGDPAGGVDLGAAGIITALTGVVLVLFGLLFAGRLGPNRLLVSRRRRDVGDAPVTLLDPAPGPVEPELPQPGTAT